MSTNAGWCSGSTTAGDCHFGLAEVWNAPSPRHRAARYFSPSICRQEISVASCLPTYVVFSRGGTNKKFKPPALISAPRNVCETLTSSCTAASWSLTASCAFERIFLQHGSFSGLVSSYLFLFASPAALTLGKYIRIGGCLLRTGRKEFEP